MLKPRSTPLVGAVLLMSLAGCATMPAGPVATARPAPAPEIRAALATMCPTPSRLSPAEMEAIADALDHAPQSHGLDLLATEWERLNAGAKACRGER